MTDLDLLDYLGRVKLVLYSKISEDWFAYFKSFEEGKTLSYSWINRVCKSVLYNSAIRWIFLFPNNPKI